MTSATTSALTSAAKLIHSLKNLHGVLMTVESCTGGLIAQKITAISGASEVFWGSLVTYDNSAKQTIAHVSQDLLIEKGAVSRETAQVLAENGLTLLAHSLSKKSDLMGCPAQPAFQLCVSTTGIAGPSGGTPTQPVGLCYIAIALQGSSTQVFEVRAPEGQNRTQNQATFAESAIEFVLTTLSKR
ncbi:nicotinamide-nucleotide amidohydrolase family protein [Bdellovibrionota bacterium FG-1]